MMLIDAGKLWKIRQRFWRQKNFIIHQTGQMVASNRTMCNTIHHIILFKLMYVFYLCVGGAYISVLMLLNMVVYKSNIIYILEILVNLETLWE